MNARLLALVLTAIASPSLAADWVLGIGTSDFSDRNARESVVISAEVHSDPFHSVGRINLSWAGAAAIHTDGDFFAGAGISALWQSRGPWFVEASLMPGYFEASSAANDLGSEFEFRSLLGIGRKINDTTRVSLAATHKSNADTGTRNPGVDTIALRWRKSF